MMMIFLTLSVDSQTSFMLAIDYEVIINYWIVSYTALGFQHVSIAEAASFISSCDFSQSMCSMLVTPSHATLRAPLSELGLRLYYEDPGKIETWLQNLWSHESDCVQCCFWFNKSGSLTGEELCFSLGNCERLLLVALWENRTPKSSQCKQLKLRCTS